MKTNNILLAGTLFGLAGVALGAFGAHALKPMLIENNRLDTYELAVRYQFYHAFALLFTGILARQIPIALERWIGWCFIAGIVCFSGSLYSLCFTTLRSIAFITPLGGVFLLCGWLLLIISLVRKSKKPA